MSFILYWLGGGVHFFIVGLIWIIIARALLSWVSPDPGNKIVIFINRVSEPLLSRARNFIPLFGGLDLSPIAVILLLSFIDNSLSPALIRMSYSLT